MPIHPFEGIFPTIDPTAFVHPDAVVIGDVHIGPRSSIWPGVVIRGDVNAIRIGADTNIQDGAILHVTRATEKHPNGIPLRIGDRVIIGHRVVLHACDLRDDCMIGMGAIVLDGAIVESEAMVGAGALVAPGKTVPARELWFGAPAKPLRALAGEEIAAMRATAENYHALAKRHAAGINIA
ncbi:MAG: gamma carbonic anhydrase family protein [Magnetococcales bacterium]|nr:gamma carbonic anhydrase family protein [Magnetococcales bacterium]